MRFNNNQFTSLNESIRSMNEPGMPTHGPYGPTKSIPRYTPAGDDDDTDDDTPLTHEQICARIEAMMDNATSFQDYYNWYTMFKRYNCTRTPDPDPGEDITPADLGPAIPNDYDHLGPVYYV